MASGRSKARRSRLWRLLANYGVCILLLLVASRQLLLVERQGLSPWRGGGFGMYSQFHPTDHRLWVSIVPARSPSEAGGPGSPGSAGFRLEAETTREIDRQRYVARRFPSAKNLRLLGQLLAGLPDLAGCERFTVQAWAPRFDPPSHSLTASLLAEVTVPGRRAAGAPCAPAGDERPDSR